ncbi:helix-turn-helix domain-containing protein [Nocardia sp. BMG111209]|uniref:winged helix-turn-helix transcriptional regulator n=1 Tax=Nocardia sp. BMG111209 TaxID=1160137 RepID=UPI00037E3220|nr:helix-turn-helix domain-containing protein [Nocardia sp. BMG111209]
MSETETGRPWTDPACPVARTVDLLGDKWSLLIVRDAFDGVTRFGQFQRNLGVAKNILADRLRNLVAIGVLRAEPASDGSRFHEYTLTEDGADLFDLVVSLRQWGRRHAFGPGESHSELVDSVTGEPIPELTYTTPDGRPVAADRTRVRKI